MVPPVGSRRRLPQHLNVTSVLYRLDKDVRIKVACLPDGYHRAQPRRAGLTGQHLAGTGSRCSSSQRKPGQQTGLARLASRVGNRNCARRGKTCRGWNQVPRASREMRQSQRKPGYSTRAGVVGLSDLGHSRQEGGWVGDWIIEPSAVRILHLGGGGYPSVKGTYSGGLRVACSDRLRSPGFQFRWRGIPLYASFLQVATDHDPGLHCAVQTRPSKSALIGPLARQSGLCSTVHSSTDTVGQLAL